MDRGAARYKRKEGQRERGLIATESVLPNASPVKTSGTDLASRNSSTPSTSRFKPKVIDNTDPARFRPKAIRDSAALLWPQAPFALPPPADVLSRVTRVDLFGSGCTDVSWLKGTKVTWLNLRGCKIIDGWDAVGSLDDLAVLNISETDLTDLPKELGALHKLKALVAMGNPWTRLDSHVIEQWDQLNSLIVSHSPKLKTLPKSLNSLRQLAKMSFSHCPCLQAGGLPDLTELPLLRDVKLNNLGLLDKLPTHISTWGTGTLPTSDHVPSSRSGDGLEVLDLGNCSLPFSAIEAVFLRRTWSHLRSLSVHSNPLAVSNPDYADLLRDADSLPNLQIIDAKRVVERKRKGEMQETRLERRRRLKREGRQSTGANARSMTDKARTWGTKAVAEDSQTNEAEILAPSTDIADSESTRSVAAGRKRKRHGVEKPDPPATASSHSNDGPTPGEEHTARSIEDAKKRKRTKSRPKTEGQSSNARPNTSRSAAMAADPASSNTLDANTGPQASGRVSRNNSSKAAAKVETIVQSAGGVNLKEVLGKPKLDNGAGTLGVGGW